MSCNTNTVPIHKVVAAAMVDSYSDISQAGVQQKMQHWVCRGFRKINNEVLKTGKRSANIYINPNTKTGTLPPDFGGLLFAGVINSVGEKIPIRLKTDLTDTNNIQDLTECVDKCPKCSQDKAICNDLSITEDTVIIVINGENYEQTITKKLYPNGDYYLETRIPVLNLETSVVEYVTQKEFIVKLDLKDCGCIEESESNIAAIRCNFSQVYCNYFAPCCGISLDVGYQIFEETGLIKFSANFPFTQAYIEYRGFLPKKNGQYHVPEVAFETLVEWIKFKEVDGKKNHPDKKWRLEQYKRERANMEKTIGTNFTLEMILDVIMRTPKFDWYSPNDLCNTPILISTPTVEETPVCTPASGSSATVVTASYQYVPFSIAVVAGNGAGTPTPGLNYYQNDKLKGNPIGINYIIVNNGNETEAAQQYTIDTTTGTLYRWQGDGITPQLWQSADVLIVPPFTKYILI